MEQLPLNSTEAFRNHTSTLLKAKPLPDACLSLCRFLFCLRSLFPVHKHVGAVSVISLQPPLKAINKRVHMHMCVPPHTQVWSPTPQMQMCLQSFSPKCSLPLQKHAAETWRARNKARVSAITGDPFPFQNGKAQKPDELTS